MENLVKFIKDAFKYLSIACAIIVVFIAGVVCKEYATNGFETFIGWVAMLEAVVMLFLQFKEYVKDFKA